MDLSRVFFHILHLFVYLICLFKLVVSDSWNPVRHKTEEAFFRAGSHERSNNLKEMEEKIDVMRKRRSETPFDSTHPFVKIHISNYTGVNHDGASIHKRPNILFLFADDLGFGDLSVPPFRTPYKEENFPCTEGGILTPQLERMAKEGVRMTNFHASAPVCSPSRTSAMTGLYPWRMTAMNAFELGRDPLQRNGFLPQIPTTAEIFRENGYFTLHSGKWHLGGMREEFRKDRAYHDNCANPSPNQHGFEEYVSELDGPETPRYTFLLSCSCLHSKGHRHLIKDDAPVPIIESPHPAENYLSDREASDAIAYMKRWKERNPNQPWFIQVWFNAPHGPWEALPAGETYYNEKYKVNSDHWRNYMCTGEHGRKYSNWETRWFYKTMVSAMDRSIGKILDALKELDIEKDTLVMFTSDNGHENGAGDPGFFKDGKRSLMEGGVRVPAIWKWKGTLPENTYTTYFGGLTDLLPTFLQASHIAKPSNLPIDGISLLPVLLKASPVLDEQQDLYNFQGRKHIPGDKEIQLRYFPQYQKIYDTYYHAAPLSSSLPSTSSSSSVEGGGNTSLASSSRALSSSSSSAAALNPMMAYLYHEGFHHLDLLELNAMTRVFLWHKDTDPYDARRDERMQSAGHYDHVKILSSSPRGCLDRIFDMKIDPQEHFNLISRPPNCRINFDSSPSLEVSSVSSILNHEAIKNQYCNVAHHSSGKYRKLMEALSGGKVKSVKGEVINSCEEFYSYYLSLKIVIIWKKLASFARTGNLAHLKYLKEDMNKATCKVPMSSQIKPLDFSSVCSQSGPHGCSIPEF